MNSTRSIRRYRQLLVAPLLALALSPLHGQEQATPVTTTPLEELAFYQQYTAPATALSLNESRISAETSGIIISIPVRVGDRVEKDGLLTVLDCRDTELQLQKAQAGLASVEAQVTLANQQIRRLQSLRKTSSVSEEQLNQQQSALKVARAEQNAQLATIAEIKLNLQRCRITAPFEGVVRERLASEGEWINPGQPVIRLIDLQRLEVSAQVSIDLIDSLRQARSIQLETNRGRFPVTIRQVTPVVDPLGRNQEVRLVFTDTRAMPGSSGRLQWSAQYPSLPADLPVRRGERLGLFLADGAKARFYPLPQAREGQPAQVELPADSLLIVEGRQALQDGDSIERTR